MTCRRSLRLRLAGVFGRLPSIRLGAFSGWPNVWTCGTLDRNGTPHLAADRRRAFHMRHGATIGVRPLPDLGKGPATPAAMRAETTRKWPSP
jgi:hypothetical protein